MSRLGFFILSAAAGLAYQHKIARADFHSNLKMARLFIQSTQNTSYREEATIKKRNASVCSHFGGAAVLLFQPTKVISIDFNGQEPPYQYSWNNWYDASKKIAERKCSSMTCTYVGKIEEMPEHFREELRNIDDLMVTLKVGTSIGNGIEYGKKSDLDFLSRNGIKFVVED